MKKCAQPRIRCRREGDPERDVWCPDKCEKLAQYVQYEWRMMVETCTQLNSSGFPEDSTVYRALVESHLVHTRTLIAFLADACPYEHDLHILRWLREDSCSYRRIAHEIPWGLFRPEWQRINKLLAHLTEDRDSVQNWQWDSQISVKLQKLMKMFADEAGDTFEEPTIQDNVRLGTIEITDITFDTRGGNGSVMISSPSETDST